MSFWFLENLKKNKKTMGKTFTIFFAAFGLLFAGCEDTDIELAAKAGIDAVRAVTLDDEDVKRLSARLSKQSDRNRTVAPPENRYARRLRRLTAEHGEYQGREFDFKVYLSPMVNAFAMADGTIRIYSGLMDMMDDRELLFVVGHEMGHVLEDHVKEKIRVAYASSAVRKAARKRPVAASRRQAVLSIAHYRMAAGPLAVRK